MARLTTDRDDPDLTHGVDAEPVEQATAYLIGDLSLPRVRPVRRTYVHVGIAGPDYPLLDLTPEQHALYAGIYDKYEAYPEGQTTVGRYWKQEQLDAVGKGCRVATTMSEPLAETYAVTPNFYGATYCVGCRKHLPVGEFRWDDGEVVGS